MGSPGSPRVEKPTEGLVVKGSPMWWKYPDVKQNELGSHPALSLTNQETATLGQAGSRENQENPSRLRGMLRALVAMTICDSLL